MQASATFSRVTSKRTYRKPAIETQGPRSSNLLVALLPVIVLMAGFSMDNLGLQLLSGALLAVVVFTQPRLGLYALILSLGNDAVDYDPLTEPFSKLYQPLSGLLATPIEVLALITCVAWLMRGDLRHLPNRTIVTSASIMAALLLAALGHGILSGATTAIALWEARGMLLVLPCIFLSSSLLREKRHVYELIAVLVGSLTLMTLELTWRYFAVVKDGKFDGVLEQAFNHDGAMLVSALFVFSAALFIWCGHRRERYMAAGIMLLAVFIVLTSRRRASVIGAESAILVLGLMLAITRWQLFIRWLPVVLVTAAVYCAAFWHSDNVLGQPVRGFQSVFQSQTLSQRDKQSDDYRIAERKDAWFNIRLHPVEGSGFGLTYAKPIPLTDLTNFWPFWAYIPHNNILWLWMKGGILLFAAFWFLLGTAVAQAASIVRRSKESFPIAISAALCSYFVMVILMAWVDLGLQSARLMILFGTGIGLLTVLERLWLTPAEAGEARTQATKPSRLVPYGKPARTETAIDA